MSVRVEGGTVYLSGRCAIEDAEELLLALRDNASAVVNIAGVQRIHLAVAQVLLAVGPELRGKPDVPFLVEHVLPLDGDAQGGP